MRNSFFIGVISCLCFFGCKSKGSHPEVLETPVKLTSPIMDSSTSTTIPYFVASGTEPFWSLEISNEIIKLKTPSDSILTPHSNPVLAQDSNVKRYSVETESSKMTIQISQTECINAMSGKTSPYSVIVDVKKDVETEFNTLKGCGHYNTDYRLHDIWVLESLNGKTIDKQDFSRELPSLEIKAAENTFSGFAGCNQMNGKLLFEKELLRFTDIATTKMMCESSNKESQFLKALQSSTSYSIENNRLTLSNPSGTILIFKKID